MGDRLPVRPPPTAGGSLVASMVDEHTRQSVLNMVERSVTAGDLVAALEKATPHRYVHSQCSIRHHRQFVVYPISVPTD
ncbi:hypothetical protein H351_31625 (plasmid) [Rhodococcus erythropolis R138]|nr:hypothetical protein H351_31625 [Rhodococcus erythropolis R138]